ncbi:MAG: hypothetical protein PUB43_02605 [Oscillospiraceae bacterium]|nr:hypothetical protein [Oscillospiraceae bacterium]
MEKPINTKKIFEFEDGSTCELTLAFYSLYMLKGQRPEIYKRYNRTMANMAEKTYEYDELDSLVILYTAYLCANIGDLDNAMSEEEFLMKCGSDKTAVTKAMRDLISPKKTMASGDRSSTEPEAGSKQ